MSDHAELVEAAGCVLWRPDDDEDLVAIIHRPKYDDWTLPKGKLDDGESHEQAAVREVAEETGWTGDLGDDLGEIRYDTGRRPKRVRFWSMRGASGEFSANDEVDELRWLEVGSAHRALTYDRDRDVLDRFVAARSSN